MKHVVFAVIFTFVAGPALAGAAAAEKASITTACKGVGSPTAKLLAFDPTDGDTANGLGIALQLGLTPATFPTDDIAKFAAPCKRSEFTAGGLVYSLYGVDEALPYRWATTPSHPGETAYIAVMPRPAPALAWYRKYQADNKTTAQFATDTESMAVLAITANDSREIYRFYSATPDDVTLAADMCAAISGELPIIATFAEGSNDIDLSHLPDKSRAAMSACGAKLH